MELNFRRKYTIVALHTETGNENYDGVEYLLEFRRKYTIIYI
jgi:hypothetical protein